jgi:hypothetical protein
MLGVGEDARLLGIGEPVAHARMREAVAVSPKAGVEMDHVPVDLAADLEAVVIAEIGRGRWIEIGLHGGRVCEPVVTAHEGASTDERRDQGLEPVFRHAGGFDQ